MNIFDFDKTIYDGDSSFQFLWFNLRRKPMIIDDVIQFVFVTWLYFLGLKTKIQAKESMFSFLEKIDDLDEAINEFWSERTLNEWYLKLQKPSDVVISASPRFLIEPFLRKNNITNVIATEVDSRTGKFLSENCYGEEKVRRFKEKYPKSHPNSAYSDSLSDIPMLKIAKQAFVVIGSEIVPLSEYQPSLKVKLKNSFLSREFALFLIIGVINTVNGILFANLYASAIANANFAFVLGYMTSLTISYFLNSWFVFHEELSMARYLKFAISYIPNFIVQNVCILVFYNLLKFDKSVAFLIAVIIGVPVTFLAIKFFAFKKGDENEAR